MEQVFVDVLKHEPFEVDLLPTREISFGVDGTDSKEEVFSGNPEELHFCSVPENVNTMVNILQVSPHTIKCEAVEDEEGEVGLGQSLILQGLDGVRNGPPTADCCMGTSGIEVSGTGGKTFSCVVCNKSFTTKTKLTVHFRTHTGEKPFSCDLCNKSFSTKGSLTFHVRSHSGEKPFICEFCNKSLTTKPKLTAHIRIHTGEKPFRCELCNKHFREMRTLASHIRGHTGEKPFICEICSESFAEALSLKKHIRSHTGEKFECGLCNKSFNWESQLNAHIRFHPCCAD